MLLSSSTTVTGLSPAVSVSDLGFLDVGEVAGYRFLMTAVWTSVGCRGLVLEEEWRGFRVSMRG